MERIDLITFFTFFKKMMKYNKVIMVNDLINIIIILNFSRDIFESFISPGISVKNGIKF